MDKYNLQTKKTARYFTLGTKSDKVKTIWFLLHGYAQSASGFLKNFEPLSQDKESFLVAPEGLHRFYIKGFYGEIGASWMTKEDRENDIQDYIFYLDSVYKEVCKNLDPSGIKVNVLGFSQGTAAACRWVFDGIVNTDKLILFGGGIPEDSQIKKAKKVLENLRLILICGDKDPLISKEKFNEHLEKLDRENIKYQIQLFEGGHEVNLPALLKAIG